MSNQDHDVNPGSDATAKNLAGTREEFNDEVTALLVKQAQPEKRSQKPGGQREGQPALEVDEESPAEPASS